MRWRPKSFRPEQLEYATLIVLAAMVGVLGGLGNLAFRYLIGLFSLLFRGLEWRLLQIQPKSWTLALVPLVLVSGGLFVLWLNWLFPEDVLGYGFPNFLEMVNLGSARVKKRWIVAKAAGAAVSLGCGASVGREGPIAQIGGAIGSAVAQFGRLSPERRKVLIACGAGAGIAATFNAPVGGLMFAQEIVLLGQTELANLTLLIIATTSGVVTCRTLVGNVAVFQPPRFVLESYWELVTYALMGLALGLLAVVYIRMFHATARWFRKLALLPWVKLLMGLAVVGLIAIALPDNLSDGYPVIDQAFHGQLAIGYMAVLALAKMVASVISLGCGAPGGVFGPIFFIGAMAGGSFRLVSLIFLPGVTGVRGSYSLVALGGFLAAATHAPLTAIFLLFEMTQNYDIALPAMICTITAMVVARALEPESIDTFGLAREGKNLQIGRDRLLLTQIPVKAAMNRNVDVLPENAALTDVLRHAGETAQATIPVVDSEGFLRGLIVTRDLLALLASGDEISPLVNAYDVGRRNCPTIIADASLDEASQLMVYESLDEIPVVDGPHGGRLLGLITRHAIAQTLNRAAVSLSTLDTRGDNLFWSTGYRVSRIKIPPAADGKTLRELDPRARWGVSVLAVQDGGLEGNFVTIDPDRPLATGNLIVAAGRVGSLRQFQRQLEGFEERPRPQPAKPDVPDDRRD